MSSSRRSVNSTETVKSTPPLLAECTHVCPSLSSSSSSFSSLCIPLQIGLRPLIFTANCNKKQSCYGKMEFLAKSSDRRFFVKKAANTGLKHDASLRSMECFVGWLAMPYTKVQGDEAVRVGPLSGILLFFFSLKSALRDISVLSLPPPPL